MINLNEASIMHNWKDSELESPIVSIWCTAYNHEKYIGKAMDSFLMQITDFPFEIVVHDDASTDKTADIIRKYEARFPNIIKPIYETENQYSNPGSSINKIMFEHSRGNFIAICEGDDYLCDNMKLQKQFNYMTEHGDCSLCCHNTVIHDITNNTQDRDFNDWKEVHILTDEDIFFGWNVHTSSYFFKKELTPLQSEFNVPFGDYAILTLLRYHGEVVSLPDVMSVYDYNVPTGATARTYHVDKSKIVENIVARKNYLKRYNDYTKGKFDSVVSLRIAELTIQSSINEDELREAAQRLRKDKRYSEMMKSRLKNQKFLSKLKAYWKIYGSIFGKVWYWSIFLHSKLQGDGAHK